MTEPTMPQTAYTTTPFAFTSAQYREACAILERHGVAIPQGSITQATIDAITDAVRGEGRSTSLRVLLVAFMIARLQAAEEAARADLWADQATKHANALLYGEQRLREMGETLRRWGP